MTLTCVCQQCGKTLTPFGFSQVTLPHEEKIECKYCGFSDTYVWLDSETKRELYKKKYHLGQSENNSNELMQKKIDVVEAKQSALEKEVELLREKLSILTKNEIKDLQNKAGDHQFNMNNLQGQLTKLQDEFHVLKQWKNNQDERQPPKN